MQDKVEYFDVELNEMFILPVFDETSAEMLKANHDDAIYRAMFASLVKLSTRPSWEHIPCFQINDTVFEIDRQGHEEHYDNCLSYFTLIEEYEICVELVALCEHLK